MRTIFLLAAAALMLTFVALTSGCTTKYKALLCAGGECSYAPIIFDTKTECEQTANGTLLRFPPEMVASGFLAITCEAVK